MTVYRDDVVRGHHVYESSALLVQCVEIGIEGGNPLSGFRFGESRAGVVLQACSDRRDPCIRRIGASRGPRLLGHLHRHRGQVRA
jgi:hypothetical protein